MENDRRTYSQPDNIPGIPAYLYRFISARRLKDIILSNRLYVPRRGELNDPFDGKVKLAPHDARKEKDIQDLVDKQMRVLSFSGEETAPTNPLMWSHYADGHRGACLKFDMVIWTRAKVETSGYVLDWVRYSKDRPLVDLAHSNAGQELPGSAFGPLPQNIEPLHRIAFTKHEDWAYEREWRMVCSQRDGKKKIYLSFPQGALAEVVMGLRMPEKERRAIRCLIKGQQQPPLVSEAQEDPTKFRVLAT